MCGVLAHSKPICVGSIRGAKSPEFLILTLPPLPPTHGGPWRPSTAAPFRVVVPGLAPFFVEADNICTLYSAAPSHTSVDAKPKDRHSVFCSTLMQHIVRPSMPIYVTLQVSGWLWARLEQAMV